MGYAATDLVRGLLADVHRRHSKATDEFVIDKPTERVCSLLTDERLASTQYRTCDATPPYWSGVLNNIDSHSLNGAISFCIFTQSIAPKNREPEHPSKYSLVIHTHHVY